MLKWSPNIRRMITGWGWRISSIRIISWWSRAVSSLIVEQLVLYQFSMMKIWSLTKRNINSSVDQALVDLRDVESRIGVSQHHQQLLPLLGADDILDHLLHDQSFLHLWWLFSTSRVVKDQVSQGFCAGVDGISSLFFKFWLLVLSVMFCPRDGAVRLFLFDIDLLIIYWWHALARRYCLRWLLVRVRRNFRHKQTRARQSVNCRMVGRRVAPRRPVWHVMHERDPCSTNWRVGTARSQWARHYCWLLPTCLCLALLSHSLWSALLSFETLICH